MLKRQICLVFSSEQSNFHDFFAKKPYQRKGLKAFFVNRENSAYLQYKALFVLQWYIDVWQF